MRSLSLRSWALSRKSNRRPQIERLEIRNLLTAAPGAIDAAGLLSGGLCACPICTGQGLSVQSSELTSVSQYGSGGSGPVASIPALSSNPNATAKLFLDFDGDFQATWGAWSNVTTPSFDRDGNSSTFSASEISMMQEIWARVAEDYAPFNIDVTTIAPGSLANKVVAHIAIGGNGSWYASGTGGVAYIGGFYNSASNVGYVFEDNLNSAKSIADACSHEAGHLFGLNHQSKYSGTTKTQEYYSGTSAWAPLMGNSYSATRSTWHYGTSSVSSTSYQDDIAILSNSSNGFGLKADDFGSTIDAASQLAANGSSVNFAGLLGHHTDQDVWEFTIGGGSVSFILSGAQYGTNLDAVLEIRDSSGTLIVTADPATSLNASISTTLGSGTFYVIARSNGSYGNMGQYTLSGTLPTASTSPEITLLVGSTQLASGDTLSFGSVVQGNSVDRTVTIRNDGNSTLTLTSINAANLPAGYSLVSNIGNLSLGAGATTSFVLRLTGVSSGSFSGVLNLTSDDADEGTYVINLSGTVTVPPAPEIALLIGSSELASGGTLSFGSVVQGNSVDRTVTIRNDGNSTLTLTAINAANLPAGYSLVSNIGNLQLGAGSTTTFVLRLTGASAGSFSGVLNLTSDDADEGTYFINLSGTVTVPPAPEITLLVGSTQLASGGTLSFGSVVQGNTVDRTVTIRNDGNSTLTLTAINAANLPAGYSLVSNIGNLQPGAGATTSFVLRLTGVSAGSFSGVLNVTSDDADEGTYVINLSGTVTVPPAPEITLLIGSSELASGGTLNFGSVVQGNSVDRTVTIRNDGNSTLTLTAINAANLPTGYSLVSNIGNLNLGAGATTTFVLRLTGASAGSFSGVLNLTSDDADEGTYVVNLSGTVTVPPAPEITLLVGSTQLASGGTLNFGSVVQGNSVDRTVTIRNDGNSTLTLTAINAANLPAGYSLVSNIGNLQLGAGSTTSFVLRLTGASAGSFTGALNVTSDDADEGTYVINLSGTVTAPVHDPEITVLVGSTSLNSGGTLSFGSVQTGNTVDRTVTICNDGTTTLTLSSINSWSLPAGFSLVSNIGSLQLGAGATTTFTLRLSTATPGSYSGTLNLLSDDADEGTFAIVLSGSVTAPTWGTVDFFLSQNQQTTGNMWFSANASRAGLFSAESYFDHNAGDVNLEIYNASGQLLGSSNSTTNAERVDVNVTAGQQLYIRVIGVNTSVTYRCVNLVSASGDTINVYGTSGDDLLVMLPGSGTHRVAVNGVGYNFNASIYTKIVVQDPGGVDTLVHVGNEQNESAIVWPASVTVTGSAYTLNVTGAEYVQLHAGEGNDSVILRDRAGDDTYIGTPTQGEMKGVGYSFTVHGFDVVDAVFRAGGFDQVFLYGSIGDDRFEASRESAFLQGPGFRHESSGYDTVVGVGGAGNDLALLHDTAGDDIFIGDPNAATLSNASMYLRAELFDRVESRSIGGYDAAYLYDSKGDDVLGASKVLAYLNGVGFSNYVEGFALVAAFSSGGNDTADLYDTAGDDRLVIGGGSRRMEGLGYAIQAENFRIFRAYASLGNDTVTMQQLVSSDKIQGRSNWITLSNNTGRTHTATGFDAVTAIANSKQKPKADLQAIDYLFSKVGW